MPFIGDGDIAVELYAERKIYGADLDPARVETARIRLEGSEIRVADCNGWPFGDISEPFAIADLDAYSNPYLSLVAFWKNAVKAKRVIVFGTDSLSQKVKRCKLAIALPSGNGPPSDTWRADYNFWWVRHVLPFIRDVIFPYQVNQSIFYRRRDMLYWSVICEE